MQKSQTSSMLSFGQPLRCRPPSRFKPAGVVTWAEIAKSEPNFVFKSTKGRRGQGNRYEKKVHEWILETLPGLYLPCPWLRFATRGEKGIRWCQPDGLYFDFANGYLTIIEVKYTHTADAYWWTQHLYLPVVQRLFPATLWRYRRCEVVKWYDPAIAFPEQVRLVSHIDKLGEADFGVHILKL